MIIVSNACRKRPRTLSISILSWHGARRARRAAQAAAVSVATAQYGASPGANSSRPPAGPRLMRTKPGCGCRCARRSARRSCTRHVDTPGQHQRCFSPWWRSARGRHTSCSFCALAAWRLRLVSPDKILAVAASRACASCASFSARTRAFAASRRSAASGPSSRSCAKVERVSRRSAVRLRAQHAPCACPPSQGPRAASMASRRARAARVVVP